MKPIKLIKGFFTVGAWTMVSRVLGFFRDAWMAAALGTGPVAQAFIIAFTLPNMFRRFFAEGAFNTAFVPMFSKKLERGDHPEAFAREAMGGLIFIVIFLTLIAQAFMPFLVLFLASGFHGDGRMDLSVQYGRIIFPYIGFISLAALASGVLNAAGRFAAAAAAPALLNVTLIGALWFASDFGLDAGLVLSWAVPLAGVVQLALLLFAAWRLNIRLIPRLPRLSPDMRQLISVAAPAMLAGGVVQINIIVGRQVTSYFENAMAWLYNADRLYQLPLGVVAIAIGIVLLPDLSRRLANNDVEGARNSFNRATEFALILTLPAAVALVVIAYPLVLVLFERGKFEPVDTAGTALAVKIYALGLPAFVLQKIFQPLFFARNDTLSPFYFATVSMFVNSVLAIMLVFLVGYTAAAIATTVSAWVMVWQLWRESRSMGYAVSIDMRLRSRAFLIVFSAVMMGVILYVAMLLIGPLFSVRWLRFLGLVILVVTGIISYFGIGMLVGAFGLSDLRMALRSEKEQM